MIRADDEVGGAGPGGSAAPVIAFFDVDNTLMRGASIYHLGGGAYRRGYVGLRDLARFAWQQARFIRVGENLRHLEILRERALGLAAGVRVSEVCDLAEEIFDRQIAPRLWPESVGLAREHLAKGHQVWLVTATPSIVAEVIARRLGLTGALGTRLEEHDGCFTGRVLGSFLHGDHKASAARELAARAGSPLTDCWAYSDSRNDIPLLELAGNRVVVNPDLELARHAVKHGWSVMRLNKSSIRAARRRVRREAKRATPPVE
ncbi:HAD-IB family hydrolase [Salinibacterium sp. SYSU T00001]|uniref:HAD family hydrolase n=1 Tax=Homoserinimonas sedimenticola TaxID=2986805 RepID=UPI002235A5E8|nr:HAD-IB family hydrolase [Salinibacterium sedimenticola]MCW4385950.1 HAD-IB family hydrolase [Salinibacterium sedimenticola]